MAIEVQGVTKRFGEFTALDEVSLAVADGSLTALLGPSGGGKSTLLRVIAGLEEPDAGEVRIAGRSMDGVPPQRRGVGLVAAQELTAAVLDDVPGVPGFPEPGVCFLCHCHVFSAV